MNAIVNVMKRDLIRSIRDNTLLYVILSPIMLALIALFVLPAVTNPEIHLIVDNALSTGFEFKTLTVSSIKFVSEDEIEETVRNQSHTIGVTGVTGNYSILVNDTFAASAENFIKRELYPSLNHQAVMKTNKGNSQMAREYTLVFIIMTTILLGGMVAGFLIVEERSLKTLEATAVSPLTITSYMFSKSFLSFIIPLVIGVVVNLLLTGTSWSPGNYLITALGGFPLGILLGLIMGYLADNQIAALGIVKLLMPVFLTIPVVSLFTPASVRWVYFIFPNYWLFESLKCAYVTDYSGFPGLILSASLSLLIGLGSLVLFLPKCARRFGLR
jgi:ABC-2 type transport system permease protein